MYINEPPTTEAEELGSREVEIESKKFVIEVKANDQGRFVKIMEVGGPVSKSGVHAADYDDHSPPTHSTSDADSGARPDNLLGGESVGVPRPLG